ncbi:hypothetical protein WCD74_22575 [Actinomycetospora sp. OC33-EN08]|uniref:Glycoside hydrolase family 42 N-terminal domain-containing protein n=1 Tax=Actinomycetospora aurantiaca TaxID=3129233 RepID=A0ABU8MUE5_9PSEU
MRWLLAGLLAGCMLVGCGAAVVGTPAVAGAPVPATLLSVVERSPAEAAAGVRGAMVELSWARIEPAPGRVDTAALRAFAADVAALRRDGRTVSLGLGLHETPEWVLALPDARLVDESGTDSPYASLVFDQRLRELAEDYLAQVARVVDLGSFATVRLGAGGLGEVLYPDGGGWWAFDRNAQNGPDLPPSMPRNPAPGWVPGSGGLSEDGVRAWADWYVGALVDVVRWQMATLSRLGFGGSFEVLTPGVGVVPSAYASAVDRGLPRGQLGTGAAWATVYAGLGRDRRVVASVTSVADGSGDNDTCTPDDAGVALSDPTVSSWSATRWITRVAAANGLAVTGENPGFGSSPELDAAYRDESDDGMAAVAWRQARSCGLRTLSWAHGRQLWDGTLPLAAFAGRARG